MTSKQEMIDALSGVKGFESDCVFEEPNEPNQAIFDDDMVHIRMNGIRFCFWGKEKDVSQFQKIVEKTFAKMGGV